ncbi:hypothetical protein V8C86DRAFT_2684253 [Haematococcus lacustris]
MALSALQIRSGRVGAGCRSRQEGSACRAAAGLTPRASGQAHAHTSAEAASLQFKHVMLCVADASPYLQQHTQQAVATAASLASREGGKVTILVVEETGTKTPQPDVQLQSITWHCNDKGCSNFDILQRATTQPASVLIGDVADEVGAECVVVSSQTVHSKLVDANQLAEFVSCPLLFLP